MASEARLTASSCGCKEAVLRVGGWRGGRGPGAVDSGFLVEHFLELTQAEEWGGG